MFQKKLPKEMLKTVSNALIKDVVLRMIPISCWPSALTQQEKL
jgi:hypothetical protein